MNGRPASYLMLEKRAFKRDAVYTMASTGLVALANVLLYKVAAAGMNETTFSEYAIARRFISTAVPFAMLGIGVALPRYIALASAESESKSLYVSAQAIICVVGASLLIISLLAKEQIGVALFGLRTSTDLVVPAVLVVVASAIHANVYGYFRGNIHVRAAAVHSVVGLGIFPTLSLLVYMQYIDVVLVAHSILLLVNSAIMTVVLLPGQKLERSVLRSEAHTQLLRFGIRRVPGDVSLMLLLGLPSFVAAQLGTIGEAGMVAVSTAFVGIFGALLSPLSKLLLPHTVVLVNQGESGWLTHLIRRVLSVVGIGGMVVVALAIWQSEWIIGVYLGSQYVEYARIFQLMILAGPPYALFVGLRSINDAMTIRAVNARASVAAVSLYIVACVVCLKVNASIETVVMAFSISVVVLAAYTLASASRLVNRGKIEA